MDSLKPNPAPLPPDEELTEVRKPASLLIAQFFLFPLIIIGICVGIFLFFGYLTYDQRTPRQYLNDIGSGSGTQRWQAAFELSNLVTSSPSKVGTPEFVENLMVAYKDSPDEDIKVRRYLALILGKLKARAAVPLLLEGLAREEALKTKQWAGTGLFQLLPPPLSEISEDLIQSQIYTLWALGSIGDNAAVPGVLEQVKNQDPSVRKMATYVAGVLGDQRAVEPLRPLLNDAREDVRWNAAIALAQLGNSEGAELLVKLLDRSHVDSLQDVTVEQKTDLMANACRALGKLRYQPALEEIRTVSEKELVTAVRGACLEALKNF
jgi:HEAT repeat protein